MGNRLKVGDRVYDLKGYIWILKEQHDTMDYIWKAVREDDGLEDTLDGKDLETLGEREQTDDEITAFLTDDLEELIEVEPIDDEPAPNHSTDPELEQYMRLLKKLVGKGKKDTHPLYPEEAEYSRIPTTYPEDEDKH